MSHNLRKRREQGSSKRGARARFLGWDQIPATGNLWNAAGRGRESLLSLLFGLFLSLCEAVRVSSPGRNGKDPIAMDRLHRTSEFPFIGNTTLANQSYLPFLAHSNTHKLNLIMTQYGLVSSWRGSHSDSAHNVHTTQTLRGQRSQCIKTGSGQIRPEREVDDDETRKESRHNCFSSSKCHKCLPVNYLTF